MGSTPALTERRTQPFLRERYKMDMGTSIHNMDTRAEDALYLIVVYKLANFMNIKQQTSPANLEKYAFLWSEHGLPSRPLLSFYRRLPANLEKSYPTLYTVSRLPFLRSVDYLWRRVGISVRPLVHGCKNPFRRESTT